MRELRHNTAVRVPVGTAVNTSAGYVVVTDLALGSTCDAAFLVKYNTSVAASVTTNTWEHISQGTYSLELTAGNVDTKGPLRLTVVDESEICPIWCDYEVVTTSFWDTKYAADSFSILLTDGTDPGEVNVSSGIVQADVQQWLSQAVPNPDAVGYPIVTIKDGVGQGELNMTAGAVDATLVTTGLDLVTSGSTFALAQADAVWDEILTGSTHNIATSAGRRLRQVEAASVHASGVIATVTNGHTFTLDAGAVATAGFYVGDRLDIIEGTGAGQSRLIVAYTSGRVCTLDSDFTTNPNTSSLYDVVAADVHVSLSDADLAAGFVTTYTNTTTLTLDGAAVATADYYKDMMIIFTHGTGAGQSRRITGYTSGRVCTLAPALTVALDTTTAWHVAAMNDLSTTGVRTAMTNQGYTTARAGFFPASGTISTSAEITALENISTSDVRTAMTNQGYTKAKSGTYPASGTILTSLSNVTVSGWTAGALAALVTTDSTKTSADLHASSVIKLAQGDAAGITPATVWAYGTRELSSGGLDNISVSKPTAVANTTTLTDFIVALFMREFNRNAINVTDKTWVTYADDSTTAVYTQTIADDGTTASYTKAT